MTLIKRRVDDDELQTLDLLALNDNENPYPGGDNSLQNAYKRGVPFVRNTIYDRTQFVDGGRVLDLCCGFGKWTVMLAEANEHVVALDRLASCTRLGARLCEHFGLSNTEFITDDVSYVNSFESQSFDFVWMWSALQYVDRGDTLRQVARLLRPGGRLYVGNYNSTGIMLQHLMKGIEAQKINEGASQWALSALAQGPEYDGCPNYQTPGNCEAMCSRFGLDLVASCPEGGLDLSQGGILPGRRPKLIHGYPSTIEFLAEKRS